MRPLRGLLVDDAARNRRRIEDRMNFEFRKLRCIVDWLALGDPLQALEIVRDRDTFDFAIVDLFYEDDSPDGFELVKHIYQKDRRTFTLLVTSFGSELPGYRDRAAP